MSEKDVCAYREAVYAGRYESAEIAARLGLTPEEAEQIKENLLAVRLLSTLRGEQGGLVPVSPEAASADLVGPAEQQIRELQQSVSKARDGLLALLPDYFESRRRRNRTEAFDVITDLDALEALMEDYGTRCRHEVLSVQPGGPRPSHLLDGARRRALERLDRGLRIQHLYQHTVRGDLVTSAYIRAVCAAGAEVRTTDQLIDRMVIYDREAVFLPEQGVEGRTPGAILVREPTLVTFLCKLYDHLWTRASVFNPDVAEAEDAAHVADDVKRSMIKLMAQGHKDEMVARRLGMSVRTCRRHISEIMEDLDSASRFQAGVNVVLSGMLDEATSSGPRDPARP
ncbi:helix-turn-helix domain-containing protein [Streptomyces beihaiensis]|uniref:HTH luxR-type domain-containing protein n=1 Tax=Streptomyces beihaiensis TaxID=2984495 RepID=A0ABT3TZH3_9ACTN|nr:hypothetical protein [Streptomyces beihaiensis]MCX3061378.1 hypothetical protein [Streptomyces beihaiensis]